ncbi:MAG: hypothetical protein WC759_05220 [Candidatus Micrarchaeia archaeon]|jgi:hypothetical protein
MGLSSRRRGFFFSGAAAVLLIILASSVMLWISAQNARSERAQLLTEGQAMVAFKQSFADGSYEDGPLRRASEVAFYKAVESVKNDGAFSGITTGNNQLRSYICGQLGKAPSQSPTDGYLHLWALEVEALGEQMGLTVDIQFDYDTDATKCTIAMADYRHVEVTYPASYTITDSKGTVMSGTMAGVIYDLDINGYDDAYVYLKSNKNALKQIFFKDSVGTTAGSVAPSPIVPDAARGKSWVYGKTTKPSPAAGSYCAGNKDQCIVVIDHASAADIASTAGYAGVILRNVPTVIDGGDVVCGGVPVPSHLDTGDCLDCLKYVGDGDTSCPGLGVVGSQISVPFVAVAPGEFSDVMIGSYVLIDSRGAENSAVSTDYHRIMDVEKMRAMSVCGFYVQNDDAPDFLQRLTVNPSPTANGIESFAIGQVWADNNPGDGATVYSDVDHEFFSSPKTEGVRVKGMPGCRDVQQCSTETVAGDASPFGHFALDDAGSAPHSEAYDAESIMCTAEGSPCDP